MNGARLLIFVGALALGFTSCKRPEAPRRDVMMEAIESLAEVVDAPMAHAKQVYDRYCSVCHGLEGKGDGFNAYNLDPKPRNFTDSSFVARVDSGLIVETITKGGGAIGLSPVMPPWGRTLSESDIAAVALYVRRLAQSRAGLEHP